MTINCHERLLIQFKEEHPVGSHLGAVAPLNAVPRAKRDIEEASFSIRQTTPEACRRSTHLGVFSWINGPGRMVVHWEDGRQGDSAVGDLSQVHLDPQAAVVAGAHSSRRSAHAPGFGPRGAIDRTRSERRGFPCPGGHYGGAVV